MLDLLRSPNGFYDMEVNVAIGSYFDFAIYREPAAAEPFELF